MKKTFFIKKHEEFSNIIKNGKFIKNDGFILYYLPSLDEKMYFGIAVSKKIGNAVTRNKVKRIMRMMIHNNQKSFKNGYKYIIMMRKDFLKNSYIFNENELIKSIGKVNENEKN